MKNKILILATFVFASFTMFATTNTSTHNRYYNNYEDSFTFVERGVTFSVFQNGEFDFYINPRNDVHIGYRSKNVNISFNSGYNYDAYVQYDNYGAIIQIENIPIYYDYYGRVDRIGNININYSFGRLVSLGGMYVHYDRYGRYSYYTGYINRYNRNYVYHPYHNFFVRPLFEYRVVSHMAYRNHYKPNRYKYYRDHSRNEYYGEYSKDKYYKKGHKRSNDYDRRKRVTTNRIPKRENDRYSDSKRRNTRDYDDKRKNDRSYKRDYDNVKKRNTSDRRFDNNTRTITNRSKSIKKRTPERAITQKRTVSDRSKSIKNRTVTNRTPIRVQEKRSVASNSRRPAVSNNRSKTVSRNKAVTPKTRKPMKRESNRTSTTRKRRS